MRSVSCKWPNEALVAYDTALRYAPDLADGWLGRGHALTDLARDHYAFSAYEKALQLKPDLQELPDTGSVVATSICKQNVYPKLWRSMRKRCRCAATRQYRDLAAAMSFIE